MMNSSLGVAVRERGLNEVARAPAAERFELDKRAIGVEERYTRLGQAANDSELRDRRQRYGTRQTFCTAEQERRSEYVEVCCINAEHHLHPTDWETH